MKCRYCGKDMILDDVDFNFKGNKNNYWICENSKCEASCIEAIRFSKSFSQSWHKEIDKVIDEYIKL